MPVHKFRKLLMHFSQQLYNKSYGIKELKAENLGTFEEWPFFNDVIMKVMIPAEKEYEEQIFSKNKIDLKESMLLLNDAVNGAFKEKCSLKYKYLFIDEFQDTDDVQIDSFLKLQNVIKDTKLFVVGDLKQSIYRFRGATISAFDLIRTDKEKWEEFSLTINYRTDKRLLDKFDAVFSKMGSKGYLPFHKGKDSLTKENRFDVTYHNHGGQLYTLEHFIVPDNRNAKIKWLTKDEESIEISFTGQSERKKKLINYLIVEQKLNNDILLDFDVIKKIELISDYYGNATPKHVGIITAHIENMESYKELKKLKNEEDEKEVENIRNCYNSFLDEYFSDNNQRTILNKLLEGLKLTFINS